MIKDIYAVYTYQVLFQMTFKRPSHNRQLTFAEIARETKLPINEIELLVMKALAQGLVKGAIDQVSALICMKDVCHHK